MPTKAELEAENRELRAQLAAAGNTASADIEAELARNGMRISPVNGKLCFPDRLYDEIMPCGNECENCREA